MTSPRLLAVLTRLSVLTGLIRERDWYGNDGMQHCRTIKEPWQAIPTYKDTIALMRPGSQHVKFDVRVPCDAHSGPRGLAVAYPGRREAA